MDCLIAEFSREVMDMKKTGILVAFTVTVILTAILGCASDRRNLTESGVIHIEQVSSKDRRVLLATAYEEGGHLMVEGKVRRGGSFIGRRGHIDIAVVGPDGEILEQSSAPILPRTMPRRRTRNMLRSHFEASLRDVPPAGSTVLIAYHRTDPPMREMSCSENEAVHYSK
jgi:hypothetical protein